MARRKLDKQKLKLEFLERLTAGESHTAITDVHTCRIGRPCTVGPRPDKEFAADIAEAKFERGCHYGYLVGEIGLDLWHNADKQSHEMVFAKRAAEDLLQMVSRKNGWQGWLDR